MSNSKTKVAILDDYLDLAKSYFEALPDPKPTVTIFKDTQPSWTHATTTDADRDAIIQRLQPFNVLCTMRERTPLPAALLQRLPNLKLLLVTGTQFQTLDIAAAKQRGILVAAAPGRGRSDRPESHSTSGQAAAKQRDITRGAAHPTTQHAWALILALARNVAADDLAVKSGGWQTCLATGLAGKTLGVCGLGRLGAATARIGVLAFGMDVVCWSASLTQSKADEVAADLGLPVEDSAGNKTFRVVGKEELFSTADVLSVHYVLSERSKGLIGRRELAAMKSSALLVNTSRGPLIDEAALLETLQDGRVRGAALDVFDVEPLPADSPWRSLDWGKDGRSQVLLTPHMGYVEEGLMHAWYDEQAENLERWLGGRELLHEL